MRRQSKKNTATLPRISPLSVSKCAASFAIPFSWLSSHYENSKSTSGYLCELKQILVDFLRAFNRGILVSSRELKFPENTAKTASLFKMSAKQAMKELCSALPNMVIYIYRRISVMYG